MTDDRLSVVLLLRELRVLRRKMNAETRRHQVRMNTLLNREVDLTVALAARERQSEQEPEEAQVAHA